MRPNHHHSANETSVSWRALPSGADVISSDGVRVGAVQETLADEPTNIFEGVVIDTRLGPGGLRFVDSSQIAAIYPDRVLITVAQARVHDLPVPLKRSRT
jgi:PRC-barrel domain protein